MLRSLLTVAFLPFALLAQTPAAPTPPPAGHRVLLQGNGRLAILDVRGEIEWEMPWGGIHDVHRLANGHVMVQEKMTRVVEIDPELKKIVWSYDAAKQNGNARTRRTWRGVWKN